MTESPDSLERDSTAVSERPCDDSTDDVVDAVERAAVAHDICARMAYRGDALATAADAVINGVVPGLGGDGGAIAVDRHGNIALPFNTGGMYRGWIKADGSRGTAIFRDD